MNWIDVVIIVFWLVMLAVGARFGSVWTAACLIGGFAASLCVDYYAVPFSAFLGQFPASIILASAVLYLGTIAVILLPGILISRTTSLLFLGIVDSAFGMILGAAAGLMGTALVLLLTVSLFPKVENSRPWKNSAIVKPVYHLLEELFNNPNFQPRSLSEAMGTKALKRLTPLADDAKDRMESITEHVVEKIKK